MRIAFSPEIEYSELLDLFWAGHDPTVEQILPRTESTIFFHDEEQRAMAESAVATIQERSQGEVRTKVRESGIFWPAGPTHHLAHYVGKNF